MQLDVLSVAVITAIVVNVSGVLFLLEMILRREERVGRVWALSFLAGMLTTFCRVVWAAEPGPVWPAAVGNGALVASLGFMWVGCRAFNRRSTAAAGAAVVVASVGVFLLTLLTYAEGDWAGALPMLAVFALFTGLGAFEAFRGEMKRHGTALGLAIVLVLVCAFFVCRFIAHIAYGPGSLLFRTWFGPVMTSAVTVVFTVVALLTTSVLRAERARVRGVTAATALQRGDDGVLRPDSFQLTFGELVERAAARGVVVGAVAVIIEEVGQIATAFGADETYRVTSAFRRATREAMPLQSMIGEGDTGELLVAITPGSEDEAREVAYALQRAASAALEGERVTVAPLVKVGVAAASGSDASATALISAARCAALAGDAESGVVVAWSARQERVDR
ncbi:hypothetical protein ACQ143_00780 [Microbacterium sp. MC2]